MAESIHVEVEAGKVSLFHAIVDHVYASEMGETSLSFRSGSARVSVWLSAAELGRLLVEGRAALEGHLDRARRAAEGVPEGALEGGPATPDQVASEIVARLFPEPGTHAARVAQEEITSAVLAVLTERLGGGGPTERDASE